LSHYKVIVERNLFNTKPPATKKTDPADLGGLKKATLNLRLWGTITSEEKLFSYAIIEDLQKRKQNLYRVGDAIQAATVTMILREKILLNVNGNLQVLEIEKAVESTKKITLEKARVITAMNDINALVQQVTIRPHFQNGKQDGLLLSSIKPDSIFSYLGLVKGDVITGVNGETIESVDDGISFYNSLVSSSDLRLKIKRRNTIKTIHYVFY
jgi:general secretion pathway protein C